MLDRLLRIGAHPLLEPHVAAGLRARNVVPRARFFLGEVRGRGAGTYVVRSDRALVYLEHGTTDAATYDQAFVQRVYEPSAEAAAFLNGLGRPPVALDAGANIGMWSTWLAHRWPGARVVAVEPVPRNVALLERNLRLSYRDEEWTLLPVAATAVDGPVSFGDGAFTNGRVLGPEDAAKADLTVEGRDLFPLLDGLDLLKLDIEGGEWPILADPRFAANPVPVVMLEHHPAGAPMRGTPEEHAERLLHEAGYAVVRTVTEFAGAGILWGVRG